MKVVLTASRVGADGFVVNQGCVPRIERATDGIIWLLIPLGHLLLR